MEFSELDTDINNYDLQDILDIIDLDESSTYIQRIQSIDLLINTMKQQNKGEIEAFLIKAKNKFFQPEYEEEEDEDDEEEDDDEEDDDEEENDEEDDDEEEDDEDDGEVNVEDKLERNDVIDNILVGKNRYELPAPAQPVDPGAHCQSAGTLGGLSGLAVVYSHHPGSDPTANGKSAY